MSRSAGTGVSVCLTNSKFFLLGTEQYPINYRLQAVGYIILYIYNTPARLCYGALIKAQYAT